MSAPSSELIYILTIANRSGFKAFCDGHRVAIFRPVRREVDGGLEHVNFRVDYVQTVGDAWAVIRGGRAKPRAAVFG